MERKRRDRTQRMEVKEIENMNESLAQMVKDSAIEEPVIDFDLPEEMSSTEQTKITSEEPCSQPSNSVALPVTTLNLWFEKNVSTFANINQVKVAIRGVNPQETLIVSCMKRSGETDSEGNVKREVHIFENASETVVLDLPAVDMQIYNNGFRIIYDYNGIMIKGYGVKSGMVLTLCQNVNGMAIPYAITRINKRDTSINVVLTPPHVEEKLSMNANLENLQLLYKQSKRSITEMTTNLSVLNWLTERQVDIYDVNHHLQIDGVIIDLLSK